MRSGPFSVASFSCLLAAASAIVLPGCVTLDELAPPVATVMPVARTGVSAGDLALGRQIYLTTCAKCHAVEPVRGYSEAEWRDILPEMEDESHLDADERRAVRAYIYSALAVPAEATAAVP